MLLTGETGLITGSTQGIGKATALRMAAEGANVVVSGRNTDRGEAVVAKIRAAGGQAAFVQCDVGVEEDVRAAVDAAVELFGSLTLLVNNAAPTDLVTTGGDNTVVEATTEQWQRILRVGLSSVFWCCKYAIPHMIAAGRGSVVNIATASALRGESGLDGYTAAKGAVVSLTRSMAVEFGSKGVRVNAIAPGFVPGDMPASRAVLESPAMSKAFRSAQLLADWGRPADVAAAVAWISSQEAKFITGIVLPVDGGATAYSRMPDLQSADFLEVAAAAQAL